jgi:hypothetical protein
MIDVVLLAKAYVWENSVKERSLEPKNKYNCRLKDEKAQPKPRRTLDAVEFRYSSVCDMDINPTPTPENAI